MCRALNVTNAVKNRFRLKSQSDLKKSLTNRLYTDLVIKIYDLDTGEKINEIKNDKGSGVKGRNIQAFDDRIVVYDGSFTDYILFQFRYDEQAG